VQEQAIALKTASSELQQALGQAASDLITASTQAKQQRIETGILQGYEKAKDIRVGEQLGTLLALTQAETVDVTELTEQLEKLRAHTDAQTADVVSNAFKKLGISTDQATTPTSPLESTLSSLPDKDSSFKIL
jgi:flagellar biosynthesis/type III secretory pathway protein FliH